MTNEELTLSHFLKCGCKQNLILTIRLIPGTPWKTSRRESPTVRVPVLKEKSNKFLKRWYFMCAYLAMVEIMILCGWPTLFLVCIKLDDTVSVNYSLSIWNSSQQFIFCNFTDTPKKNSLSTDMVGLLMFLCLWHDSTKYLIIRLLSGVLVHIDHLDSIPDILNPETKTYPGSVLNPE